MDTLFADESPDTTTTSTAPNVQGEADQAEDGAAVMATIAPPHAAVAPVPDPAAPSPLPFAGPPVAEQQLATANAAVWKLLDEHRLDPTRPPSGPYRRITDFRVRTTDPDATPLGKGHDGRRGDHDHYVVDGGKARIILAAFVTPADVQDNQVMIELLDRVRFRYHLPVRRAVADSTYGTGENPRALEERGVQASIPVPEYDRTSPFVRPQDVTCDRVANVYRCPRDTVRALRATDHRKGIWVYQAPAAVCQACPRRARCTEGTTGRRLTRPFDEDYRERAREVQATAAYQKALRKRQVWVEPLFGEAKDGHGVRRFRVRSLGKVNCEGLLVAAGQNLKRWLTRTGWGRRHGPAGSLALAPCTSAPAVCGALS